MKIHIRTLGCPKNDADSDLISGAFEREGWENTDNPDDADVVIVNTCAFVEAARQESIDAILEESRGGKKLVVTGCMVERYKEQLADELPEVHAFVGLGSYSDIVNIVNTETTEQLRCWDPGKVPLTLERGAAPRGATSVLKISEGCDRICSFCAIPAIRGPHRSRTPAEIVSDAEWLAASGVRELVLVGQDMSLYGRDLTGGWLLPGLLREVGAVDGIEWIRTLYQYPGSVTDELLHAIAETPAAVPYLDLSLQHCSDHLLRAMKRPGSRGRHAKMINRIREILPDATLRSAFIIGFPGETEDDVEQLADFLTEHRLDWVGFFSYSPEEGTSAFDITEGHVAPEVTEARIEALSALQMEIAESKREALVGQTDLVLIENFEDGNAVGRSWREAPDVDGQVVVSGAGLRIGDMVDVEYTSVDGLDLVGVASAAPAVRGRRRLTVQ